MAGTRRAYYPDGGTKPTRAARRAESWLAQLHAAATAEEQAAVAFAFARAVIYRHPRRADLLHDLATDLANTARRLEGSIS